MSLTLQVLLGGIAAGAVYGVVAIGHTIIFRLTGVVHFAFGDLIGLGVFTCLAFAVGTAPATQAGIGGERFLLAVAAAGAVCFAVGVATYLFVIEPFLARGSVLGWVGGVVAVALAIEAFLNSEFARPSYVFPDPLPFRHVGTAGIVQVGGATFQVRSLFVIGVGVLLALGATWTLRATPFGRALTAIAQDPEAAHIVGLEVRSLTALAFGLVGTLAAVLAVVAAPGAPFGTQSGALYGLKGLVAAVVVGFAGPWRAFAAGIAFGLAEAFAGSLELGGVSLGPAYREVLPLAIALALIAGGLVREVVEEAE